ncbi:MAG: type II/IV secretion system ATPase subunit [Candidatus Aenigmarchaeota archaeon]|nr:type II/IV secretion system ATPase subunit [Candidatus Aenigmarchaeota archaeon]
MAAVEYEVSEGALRIIATNWAIPPSIEDSEATMAIVIDKLLETKDVNRVILVESRENEYDFEQTQMLHEIAYAYDRILNQERLLTMAKIEGPNCEKHTVRRLSDLQFLILEVLRKDPIGAYVRLKIMLNSENKAAQNPGPDQECHYHYLANCLEPMMALLEGTSLIKRAIPRLGDFKFGDRTLYREFFSPVIRPNFMLTRYMAAPPKNGKSLAKYYVGNTLVEVFQIPGKVRLVYHITPQEFTLTEEQYSLLDTGRRYLSAHKPSDAEFTDPEKSRDVFLNIGRDMIRDLSGTGGVRLSSEEVENLATILTRYTAGFGILELLLADDKVQDIFVNSPIGAAPVYIYHQDFEECETNLIPTRDDADSWATRFRLFSGRPLDEANPVLDTELITPGGRARVAAITRSLSPEGLAFAFRRHREKPWTLPLFIKSKHVDPLFSGLNSFIVDGGRAMLIAGGRGSGKTSLLGAILLEIMKKHRMIIVEDTLELPVVEMRKLGYNVTRLKSRSVITKVETELAPDEALRTALRLGDSVLVVGEVRSTESVALFEAMRIGALANVVAGTIHGESPYGVFDRVVNDLGVKPTSFKAIDIITVSNMLKSPDGLHRFRRVIEMTEVRKKWKNDPADEGGFVPLMEYSAKEDRLKPSDTLMDGESEVLNSIARNVKDWRGSWDLVWENIMLRTKIKQTIVDYSEKLQRPEIMEADWTTDSNDVFHIISDQVRQEVGALDSNMIYDRWLDWFKARLK